MTKRLTKAHRAELIAILDRLNSGEHVSKSDIPPYLLHYPLWSAGENMPGCLPDTPYLLFLSERAARGYCRALEREPGGGHYVSDYMPVTLREIL